MPVMIFDYSNGDDNDDYDDYHHWFSDANKQYNSTYKTTQEEEEFHQKDKAYYYDYQWQQVIRVHYKSYLQ